MEEPKETEEKRKKELEVKFEEASIFKRILKYILTIFFLKRKAI